MDLSGVSFFDASGIRLLHLIEAHVRRQHGTVRLVCPPGFVRGLLELVGITRGLTTVATLEEALPAAPMSSA
ncbi:STAS domain-containing protein [Phaeacidiphilus oryzae]|uniref:STAS domain-containing protein n=1 Tax=Phaeacidiphilus oryzae TaxID=348818 RepID=UPI000A057EA8|nr:STAS domain-containing protein [Phaeacidiphilus oryzae]